MKKLLLVMVAVAFTSTVSAQNFNAGINAGFPSGDASDFSTFAIAVDLGYLFDVSDNFDAGFTTGVLHSFGDEYEGIEWDDHTFLPIAAAARLGLGGGFGLGADVGYALGLNDGNEGGFYYAPRLSYSVSDGMNIVAGYRGVSNDGSWDNITIGIEFGL